MQGAAENADGVTNVGPERDERLRDGAGSTSAVTKPSYQTFVVATRDQGAKSNAREEETSSS
jgi:hypothetical protein